jgi:hypothetical protein
LAFEVDCETGGAKPQSGNDLDSVVKELLRNEMILGMAGEGKGKVCILFGI